MSFRGETTEARQALKRSFASSLDGSERGSLPPTKRHHQLPPTPPTPRHSPDKFSPLSDPLVASPSLPQPLQLSKKRVLVDIDPACHPIPKRCRLEGWLESVPGTPPGRACSCPPQLENTNPLKTVELDQGQPLSFDILQEMSHSNRQNGGASSVGSGRSSRPSTSHADYRKTLRNNGISIDPKGKKIPPELRVFLDTHILKGRSSKLSHEAITKAEETAIKMAESPEGNIYELTDTAMLPIKRSDVGRGGNTPWYSDGLPRNEIYSIPLAAPKADIHLGYPTDHTSEWKVEENAVIDHPVARRWTQPAKGNCFPFFILELKSEAMGGNHWQAENQAAGSGASCVNAVNWLFREAYPSKDLSVMNSIAFSACVTHRLVSYFVHFYLAEERRHCMSWIANCETMRHVQESNHLVKNIFQHCVGARQAMIRKAIARLHPFPDHWKRSRPACVVDSLNPAADEEISNKSQRVE